MAYAWIFASEWVVFEPNRLGFQIISQFISGNLELVSRIFKVTNLNQAMLIQKDHWKNNVNNQLIIFKLKPSKPQWSTAVHHHVVNHVSKIYKNSINLWYITKNTSLYHFWLFFNNLLKTNQVGIFSQFFGKFWFWLFSLKPWYLANHLRYGHLVCFSRSAKEWSI